MQKYILSLVAIVFIMPMFYSDIGAVEKVPPLVHSPPLEGCQAQPDGVVFCVLTGAVEKVPPLVHSPPMEGWQAQPDGVVVVVLH